MYPKILEAGSQPDARVESISFVPPRSSCDLALAFSNFRSPQSKNLNFFCASCISQHCRPKFPRLPLNILTSLQEVMGGKSGTKAIYFDKLKSLLDSNKSIFIVAVDNVSSQQMHEIRGSLRGQATVLMGKNTMVRRAIKGFISEFPDYERLLPHIKGG